MNARPSRSVPLQTGHRDIRRVILAGAAGTGLALWAGCAIMPPANLRPPDISLADLALVDIGLDRLKFRVGLDTQNPNDIALPLSDIRVDLSVLGVVLAEGYVIDRRIDIPPAGRLTVPVEFIVPTSRVLDVATRLRSRGWESLEYRLAGRATWGNGPFSVPFERSGDLSILRRLGTIFSNP